VTPRTRSALQATTILFDDHVSEERRVPKNVSITDPAARSSAAPGGPAFYAYLTNYLVDSPA